MAIPGARNRPLLILGLVTALTLATAGTGQADVAVGATTAHTMSDGSGLPTGVIHHAGGATAVPGSYLVVLKDDAVSTAAAVPTAATSLARTYGGVVNQVFTAALRGFEVRLDESAARRLAADPAVAYVEQNHRIGIRSGGTQYYPPNWGLDRIDQRQLPLDGRYQYRNKAPNVRAYIFGTGIRRTAADFNGAIPATVGYDAVDGALPADDCNGHGTHMAGIVGGELHGVAKDVQLIPVRVLDCGGSGTNAGVIAGINWVTANIVKPGVVLFPLNSGSGSTALITALTNSINSGILYVAGVGGSAINACTSFPVGVPGVLNVAGTTQTDARASWSNYGPCVHLFAPGANITSTWHTSDTATNTISGTSAAAAHVAGCAAVVLSENPLWSPAQVAAHLTAIATPNVVTNPGANTPNRLLYCGP